MRREFHPRLMSDGRAMLNLACGERSHPEWTNIDFFSVRLLHYNTLTRIAYVMRFISRETFERTKKLDANAYYWDLRKGIPFRDSTFDVVYHSHFLEHLEKEAALPFLQECRRVLKNQGIIRVVVPDLRKLALDYLSACRGLDRGEDAAEAHELATINLIDQMVRKEPGGQIARMKAKSRANWAAGVVEFTKKILRGSPSAERSGELHKWMYDRFSLHSLLEEAGFGGITVCDASTSSIKGWNGFYLDLNSDGSIYKPESLYVEGTKTTTARG
jgi:SAM-dependent methyltransferase